MTYEINNQGIQTPELADIINNLITQYQNVYGANINVSQNTPDGQLINIKAQNQVDTNEVANYIYNSFDPRIAEGRALDRNVAYHGIKRNGGSYSQIPINLNINATTTLQGLDNNYNDPTGTGFTVADNAGNNYILITTTIVQTGNNILSFRAQNLGVLQPQLNSITNIITPQVGVIGCNNPSAPIQIGVDEESDYDLRNRFNNSFELGGYGNFGNVISALYDLEGVNSVSGENNYTNVISANGTEPHTVWLIIQGGADDELATTIWQTLSSGCGMRGNNSIPVKNIFGNYDYILFDRPTIENLFIEFDLIKKNNLVIIDETYLKQQLINNLKLVINQQIDISQINCILTNINNNLVYSKIKVSKNGTDWFDLINNTNINYIFTLSINNIIININ